MKLIMMLPVLMIAWQTSAAEKPKSTKPISSELLAASQASDWRPLDLENTLYMDLANGRVIIELAPDFAPQHVANIKALAREKYWDGLAVVRVQDGYVVQWADPNSEKADLKRKIKTAKETLPAEFDRVLPPTVPFKKLKDKDVYAAETGFSNGFAAGRDPKTKKAWLLHCYGSVGAGRDVAADSGGGSELYAVIGHSPRHLDRNTTVVGRVVQGVEFLSSLPRGHGALGFYEKPEQNVAIKSIKLASDVPEKERVQLEVLRTDTPLFEKLIEAKRNRAEDWFHFQAGHVEACNVTVPVRKKP
ncbi:MAG: peptidylprolyl isomerase [Bdellovibrionales bacterium]